MTTQFHGKYWAHAIDAQRDELIGRIKGQLRQKHTVQTVFRFCWRLA